MSTAGCLGQGAGSLEVWIFIVGDEKGMKKKVVLVHPRKKNGWTIQMIRCGRGISGRNE